MGGLGVGRDGALGDEMDHRKKSFGKGMFEAELLKREYLKRSLNRLLDKGLEEAQCKSRLDVFNTDSSSGSNNT